MNYTQAKQELESITGKQLPRTEVIAYMNAKNTELQLSKISSNLAGIVTAINTYDGESKIASALEDMGQQIGFIENKI